jgi:hypothetical protein
MVLQNRWELFVAGATDPATGLPVSFNAVWQAGERMVEAECALSNKPVDRLAIYEKDWEAKYLTEKIAEGMWRVCRVSTSSLARSRFDRLDAEIRLLEAEAKRNKN